MSKPTHDIVASIGEYKTASGETKKRYVNCGKAFTSDKGISLKIDSMPVSPEWSGWLSLYPVKEQDSTPQIRAQSSHNTAKANAYQPEPEDEQIPF